MAIQSFGGTVYSAVRYPYDAMMAIQSFIRRYGLFGIRRYGIPVML